MRAAGGRWRRQDGKADVNRASSRTQQTANFRVFLGGGVFAIDYPSTAVFGRVRSLCSISLSAEASAANKDFEERERTQEWKPGSARGTLHALRHLPGNPCRSSDS